MTATMKALCIDKPGKIESLYLDSLPLPEPAAGQIRVKVMAVGLNPVDYKIAAKGHPDWRYPFVLGLDVVGIIDQLGEGVEHLSIGQPVFYHGDLREHGGFAEYAVTWANAVSLLPAGLSPLDAAALPCAGFTAYQAIHRKLRAQAGKTILVHGGAGGVGGFAVQLAKLTGLKVLTTCSRRNFDYVLSLGADYPIDYSADNVQDEVMKLTADRGVDYVIDTVGGACATESLRLLAFNGELVCCAGFPDFTQIEPFKLALSIHEVALGGAHLSRDAQAQAELAQIGQDLGALVVAGSVSAMVEDVISLKEIPDGLLRLKGRHVRGKIVVRVGEES